MAKVLEEKSEVMRMKIDLLFLLSVDPGVVNSHCWYIVRAPSVLLHLIFIINKMAQTWTGLSFFFFFF